MFALKSVKDNNNGRYITMEAVNDEKKAFWRVICHNCHNPALIELFALLNKKISLLLFRIPV